MGLSAQMDFPGLAAPPPTKACHNCRRRRLRCDRSYPCCHKCTAAGQECLGYGKLFRWTDSVASRGKLAGKTTFLKPQPRCTGTDVDVAVESSPDGDSQLVHCKRSVESELSTPWGLVDPLFQDLEYPYRHYLSYFTNRVCKDLVAHDLPDRNPFRSLIPLTKDHALLQHIIVATSAAHMSNLSRAKSGASVSASGHVFYESGGEPARRALLDALVAKQKALRLLNVALQDIESACSDVVLAAVLFFINVELMESGKHGWKAHIEGAGRIMAYLQPDGASDESLRDYILSDCFIYYILGSAFMTLGSTAQSYYQSARISAVLEKAAVNSYLCCPPEILQLMLAASQLSNETASDAESAAFVAQAALLLMEQARSFDVQAWAYNIQQLSSFKDLQSRVHAASAHRSAACLYILQAVPFASILIPTTAEELVSEVFYHLSCVPEEDNHFKATTWPTFIAGAEATDPAKRAWVLDRLQVLVVNCPWGFIYTAMETLQVIWNLDDSADPEKTGMSWVQKLKAPDLNFLMV